MAETPATSTKSTTSVFKKLDLGRKVGPLPLGAWVVIVGAAIGFYLYYRTGGGDTEESEEIAEEMEDVGVPDGVGEGPGYTYFPPPVPLPSDDKTIRTNREWARFAIEKTIRETSINNNTITQTVTKYINSQPLTEGQRNVLQQVFEIAGSPPKPLPIIHVKTKGGGGGDNPKPPPFPSPGTGSWHKIKRGQTLQGIAARYYTHPRERWRDIFNANRKGRNRPGPQNGFLKSPEDIKNHVGRWLWIPGPTPKGPNL